MKILHIELELSSREAAAFLDDCLINRIQTIVNNVDLSGVYRTIAEEIKEKTDETER